MPTPVLKEKMSPPVRTSGISTPRIRAKKDRSLEGVLIFSGIGVGLLVLAAIFQYLQLPPPYF
jgi:hypothetical protein